MRQVGVIASMADKSLDLRERILEDHQKARDVFDFICEKQEFDGFFKAEYKNTNMIFLEFSDGANSQNFIKNLEKEGVLSGLINDKTVRLVFHKDVSTDDMVHVKEKIYSSSLIWFHSVIDFSERLTKIIVPTMDDRFTANIYKATSLKQSPLESARQNAFPKR